MTSSDLVSLLHLRQRGLVRDKTRMKLRAFETSVRSQVLAHPPSHARTLCAVRRRSSWRPAKSFKSTLNRTTKITPTSLNHFDLTGLVSGMRNIPLTTAPSSSTQTLQLNTRRSNKSWLGDDDGDEEDPFAEIEDNFDEADLEANLLRDKKATLCASVSRLVEQLQPSAPSFALRDTSDELVSITRDRS